jgi:Domain of unknown function (DUF4265)
VGYREHPSKVARLVEGQFVGYPPAEEEDCTLWVALPGATDEWEGVLGRRLTDDSAELVGIPVFAYDLNLGDVARVVTSAGGALVVSGIIAASGNYTFRAMFEGESRPGEHWKRLMVDLERLSCWFDAWSETLVGISADAAKAQAVADYLAAREAAGELKYETGRSR